MYLAEEEQADRIIRLRNRIKELKRERSALIKALRGTCRALRNYKK